MRKTATALTEAAKAALGAAKITDDGLGVQLQAQLDYPVYREVAEALTRAGFKWNRGKAAHMLIKPGQAATALTVLGEMIGSGIAPAKNALCWFPTPPAVALRVAELAADWRGANWQKDPYGPIRILEPSVGEGALLLGLLDYLTPLRRTEFCSTAPLDVWCVEIDRERGEVAYDLLNGRFQTLSMHYGDFLAYDPKIQFDLVLMNPPWDAGAAVAHVLSAWELLAPGGRLVAILPGSTPMKGLLGKLPTSGHWEPLPEGTFHDAGTEVSCGILVLDKPA